MVIQGREQKYNIHFWHGKCQSWRPGGGLTRGTVCTIHLAPCRVREKNQPCKDPRAVMGETRYNPSDRYDRRKGRAQALARAMKAAGLPIEERRVLWQDYLKKIGIATAA